MNNPCRQCGIKVGINSDSGLCLNCEGLQAEPDDFSKRKSLAGLPMHDMKSVDEAKRFDAIANHLRTNRGALIGVIVDCGDDYEGKGDRYLHEIEARVPGVKLVSRKKMKGVAAEVLNLKLE